VRGTLSRRGVTPAWYDAVMSIECESVDARPRPWEFLDVQQRMFGVFDSEAYSPDPIAIFRSEDAAHAWLDWQMNLHEDIQMIENLDYVVCVIDDLIGVTWNSHKPPPVAR